MLGSGVPNSVPSPPGFGVPVQGWYQNNPTFGSSVPISVPIPPGSGVPVQGWYENDPLRGSCVPNAPGFAQSMRLH